MSIPQLLRPLALSAGYRLSTLERTLRVLRPAGLVPDGERGRGDGPEWLPVHLAHLLFSFVGQDPVDAAEIAKAYAACIYTNTTPHTADKAPLLGPGTLGEILAGMIEGVARGLELQEAGTDLSSDPTLRRLPHQIDFRNNPLRADLVWRGTSGTHARADVYSPKREDDFRDGQNCLGPWRSAAITRVTIIPGPLIHAAGELLFVTRQRRNPKPRRTL